MKKFSETLQKYFMATAFTDVGEFDKAVEILEEKKRIQKRHLQEDWKMPRVNTPRA